MRKRKRKTMWVMRRTSIQEEKRGSRPIDVFIVSATKGDLRWASDRFDAYMEGKGGPHVLIGALCVSELALYLDKSQLPQKDGEVKRLTVEFNK